jgi:hypothetical protein
MAKGQKRSNREPKKPKTAKPKAGPATSALPASQPTGAVGKKAARSGK